MDENECECEKMVVIQKKKKSYLHSTSCPDFTLTDPESLSSLQKAHETSELFREIAEAYEAGGWRHGGDWMGVLAECQFNQASGITLQTLIYPSISLSFSIVQPDEMF